jgi:hypothetical protein
MPMLIGNFEKGGTFTQGKPTDFGRELGGPTKINRSAEWQTSHRALGAPDQLTEPSANGQLGFVQFHFQC